MDLNYLLFRHQISLTRAANAACCASRHSHRDMAKAYAERIRVLQDSLGATVAPLAV